MNQAAATKRVFIPGWLDVAKNYHAGAGLDIWNRPADPDKPIAAGCLIGYSLGANFALCNWQRHRQGRLVLVNPLLARRPFRVWLGRWWQYLRTEAGRGFLKPSRVVTLFFLPFKLGLAYRLLSQDYERLLAELKPEQVVFIRGRQDQYLCDESTAALIRAHNLPLVEVATAGHNWSRQFNEIIDNLEI